MSSSSLLRKSHIADVDGSLDEYAGLALLLQLEGPENPAGCSATCETGRCSRVAESTFLYFTGTFSLTVLSLLGRHAHLSSTKLIVEIKILKQSLDIDLVEVLQVPSNSMISKEVYSGVYLCLTPPLASAYDLGLSGNRGGQAIFSPFEPLN
jgi:hypothetical protein